MLKIATNGEICFPIKGKYYFLRSIIENCIKIVDENKEVVPLKLNEAQNELLKEITECVANEERIRFVILKARQMGFSTFIAAIIFCLTVFQKNRTAIIIAHQKEAAMQIFKMYQRFYEELPKPMKPKLRTSSSRELMTIDGSSIRVLVQGDSVRGTTINYAHLSEAAFYDKLDDTLTALLRAVQPNNLENMVFIESTANGFNAFKDYYDQGVSRKQVWRSVFYAWYQKPNNRLSCDGFTLTPREEALRKEFNLDYEQIARYRYSLVEAKNDIKKMQQENPSKPSDAFISTGNSVFDNEQIAYRKEITSKFKPSYLDYSFEVKTIDLDNWELINVKPFNTFSGSSNGCLTIYKEPVEGRPYVMGIDPARGKGIDNTIFQVIDNISGEQVAVYSAFNEDNDISAAKSVLFAKYYNDALIVPETNTTDAFVKFYMRVHYTNVYRREVSDDSITKNLYELYGVKTGYNKKTMVDNGVMICREKTYSNINDFSTLCEMESFVYEVSSNSERLKAKGSGKAHDDRVMALLIAYYGRGQQEAVEKLVQTPKQKRMGFDPFNTNIGTVLNNRIGGFKW